MNTFEDFILFILVLASIIWCIVGCPIGYGGGRQQGICETTYSGSNYIDGECLIPAKK